MGVCSRLSLASSSVDRACGGIYASRASRGPLLEKELLSERSASARTSCRSASCDAAPAPLAAGPGLLPTALAEAAAAGPPPPRCCCCCCCAAADDAAGCGGVSAVGVPLAVPLAVRTRAPGRARCFGRTEPAERLGGDPDD